MIRGFLIGTVSSIALASAAFASDLPNTKGEAPYIPPPVPVFTWTGFYVGGNAGLSGGNSSGTLTESEDSFWETDRAKSMGFSGGGQIGYNYQFPTTNFVVGLEADFQGSTLGGSYLNEAEGVDSVSGGAIAQSKVNWWGTVRGRAGYAFGNILPYVTGGLAYGRVTNSFDAWETGVGSINYSYSSERTGWTVGAGVEYALTQNLTIKVEYLYTDLGCFTRSWSDSEGTDYLSTKTTFNTVRAGLNWKFDWLTPPAPVMAKY